ncbi:hypothetical protein [Streptomyces sp. CC219B]|uniref:hypothetical protein n=1 Tax=Streptomyces sp. CC219B TaxID=3044574 RepID=UPI0024A99CEC|nr:hypothetical protein [Streptomyces sp. CC219B]
MPHVRTEYDARPAPWRVGLPVNEVPSPPPAASGAFYTMEAFWTAAGVAVAVLVGCGAMWAAFRAAHPKRRLTYTVRHRPMVPRSMDGGLEIRRNGTLLTDPHLVEVVLTNPSRWDIASHSFDRNQPIQVDLAVPYLEVTGTESSAGSAAVPPVEVNGTRLWIGPGLIGRRTTITYHLLVDSAPVYDCRHSLVDVDVQQVAVAPARPAPLVRP